MDYMKLFQKGFDNLRVCAGPGICQRDHIFAFAHPPCQGELHPHDKTLICLRQMFLPEFEITQGYTVTRARLRQWSAIKVNFFFLKGSFKSSNFLH